MGPKQYVFLIHGTWGYEDDARAISKPWYSKDSDFASSLRKKLAEHSHEQAQWELRSFLWPDCDNKHEDRIKAGQALAQEIENLRRSDPDATINFVAHSHGGNVLLEALSIWFGKSYWVRRSVFDSALTELENERDKSQKESFKHPPKRDEVRARLEKFLQRAGLPENSTAALIEELCGVPESTPVPRSRFLRDLDIRVFDPIWRDYERKRFWSSEAAASWVAHPAAHGIGRLVFLGTPFLLKKWHSNRNGWSRAVEKMRQVSRAVIGLLLTVYVVGAILTAFVEPSRWWNPTEWPLWADGVAFFFAMVSLPALGQAITRSERRDTNIYFDQGSEELRLLGRAMSKRSRIRCLVFSAGLMDEALLGLSAEAVLQAAFRPQLRRLFGLESDNDESAEDKSDAGNSRARPDRARDKNVYLERGVDWFLQIQSRPGLAVGIIALATMALNKLFLPVSLAKAYLWRWAVAPVVERYTVRTVRRVMEMTALGLSGKEFLRARIAVSPHVGLAEVFDECFSNVTEHAITTAPFHKSARDRNRYAFLLNKANLPSVEKKTHHLYGSLRHQRVNDRELLQTALVIDERVREAVGAVGLIHSTYYGDEEVISGASHFIRTGNLPMSDCEGGL